MAMGNGYSKKEGKDGCYAKRRKSIHPPVQREIRMTYKPWAHLGLGFAFMANLADQGVGVVMAEDEVDESLVHNTLLYDDGVAQVKLLIEYKSAWDFIRVTIIGASRGKTIYEVSPLDEVALSKIMMRFIEAHRTASKNTLHNTLWSVAE